MSDGKEVKRYIPDNTPIYLVGESTPEPTTCVVLGRDHDRIVAEKDAKIVRLTSDIVDCDRRIAELRAEVEKLRRLEDAAISRCMARNEELAARDAAIQEQKQTIARQARVIEIATRSMATVLEIEHCGETSCPRPMRAMCSNESHMVLRESLKTIAVIERAEWEKE